MMPLTPSIPATKPHDDEQHRQRLYAPRRLMQSVTPEDGAPAYTSRHPRKRRRPRSDRFGGHGVRTVVSDSTCALSPGKPVLRFTPYAWAKLVWMRDRGDTEIGGFAVALESDSLFIVDFVLVRQSATMVSVAFDDEAVADYFDEQVDAGRRPEQFARVWVHTHPGNSATPSGTDEETFSRSFGGCDWSVMFILAKGGDTYARLRFNVGPGAEMTIPVVIDYGECFAGVDETALAAWDAEYEIAVVTEPEPWKMPSRDEQSIFNADDLGSIDLLDDPFYEQLVDEWIVNQYRHGAEESVGAAQAS